MKNDKKLDGKRKNIMICWQCKFFPILKQLKKCKLNRDLFYSSWTCQYCSTINTCEADNQFRYFCTNGQLLIDESQQHNEDILFLIDISQSMHQTYYNLSNYNLSISGQNHQVRKNLQMNKKQLMEQSKLLTAYLQCQSVRERLNKGRFFSWDNFLKQKNLTKIEYSLWLVDYLKKKIKNIESKFFYSGNSKEALSYGILNPLFFKKLGIEENEIGKNVIDLQNIEGLSERMDQIVVISASNIKQLLKKIKREQKIAIINIQQVIDPITLEATSTGQRILKLLNTNPSNAINNEKVQRGIEQEQKYVRILDSRELDIPNFKQFANFIKQYLIMSANSINIFQYRTHKVSNQNPNQVNVSQSNKSQEGNIVNGWIKIKDKNIQKIFMDLLQKRHKQKNVGNISRVFHTLQKPKQADLTADLNGLINKILNWYANPTNNINLLPLIQEFVLNINNNSGKKNFFRMSIELKSHLNNKRFLILLQNNPFSALYPSLEKSKQNSAYFSPDDLSLITPRTNASLYYDNEDEQQYCYFNDKPVQILQNESLQRQESSISQPIKRDENYQFL